MSWRRLDRLAALAAMIKEAELAALARQNATVRRIESERREVKEMRQGVVDNTALDVANLVGQDQRFLDWTTKRLSALSAETAAAAAEAETAKVKARRAFGRASVLSQLAAQAKTSEKKRG